MSKDFCFFCHTRENPTTNDIYEDGLFMAHLCDVPVNPGHVELFPKRHFGTILEMNEYEQVTLVPVMQKIVKILTDMDFKKYYDDKSGARDSILKKSYNDRLYEVVRMYVEKMQSLPYLGQKPTGFNYGINQGMSAGQTVMHLHIHIIPRFDGDVTDPTGGVRNFMNDLGNYRKHMRIENGTISN